MRKRTLIAIIITVVALTLTNRYWLISHPISIDFKIFVIIAVLTYLSAFKISNYVADFKSVKGKSRIEIIFLTIFFVFLFVPMIYINQDEKSRQENRFLAKWYPLVNQDGEFNYDFGKNFSEWFNDRFFLRHDFVKARNYLTILVANKCDKGVFDKKTQITYTNWDFGHIDIETTKNNFKALYALNDFCQKHNIKLYILIVPQKGDIHTTELNYIKDEYKHNDFLSYIQDVQQEDKIKVIYPYEKMKNAAENGQLLYFKTEHHWTDDGAFIGYQELMKVIEKDYPNIKVLSEDDFNHFQDKKVRGDFGRGFDYGQNCFNIGIPKLLCKMYHQYDYDYYKYKDFENLEEEVINIKYHFGKLYHYDKGADYRVIQLGTSQNENLTEFIPFTFKDVKRLRNNNVKDMPQKEEFKIMKYYEKEILDYKPDMIIFCITYSNIWVLNDLFKE